MKQARAAHLVKRPGPSHSFPCDDERAKFIAQDKGVISDRIHIGLETRGERNKLNPMYRESGFLTAGGTPPIYLRKYATISDKFHAKNSTVAKIGERVIRWVRGRVRLVMRKLTHLLVEGYRHHPP